MDFDGAKVALFLGDKLAVILRDDLPGLPFAGCWDMPGGGREGDETPFACMAREVHEELGLRVARTDVVWSRAFVSAVTGRAPTWFFVAQLPAQRAAGVIFGDEGQRWALMTAQEFLAHPNAITAFQDRLRVYLNEREGAFSQKE